MFNVDNKEIRKWNETGVVLVSLRLTLNIFQGVSIVNFEQVNAGSVMQYET